MHLKEKNACILITRDRKVSRRSNLSTKLLSFHFCESLNDISPELEVPHSFITHPTVSNTCNGLLCFSDMDNLVLGNPGMREFKVLPPHPFTFQDSLVFIRRVELGFDSIKNQYKVVAFIERFGIQIGPKVITGIYNLSSNSWRNLDYDSPSIFGQGVQVDRALHYFARRSLNMFILTFDLSKELFGEIEIPDDLKEGIFGQPLSINGSLAVFVGQHGIHQFGNIWVMKEYGVTKSWTKQARVGPIQGIQFFRTHMLWKNEAIFIQRVNGEVVSRALDSSKITGYSGLCGDEVMLYEESLISVHSDGQL